MQYPHLYSPVLDEADEDDDRNWVYIIYARVLLQMFEDLEKAAHRPVALYWFSEEIYEVALVCCLCRVSPVNVYREVVRALHQAGVRAGVINVIRRHLRRGQRLERCIQSCRMTKAA